MNGGCMDLNLESLTKETLKLNESEDFRSMQMEFGFKTDKTKNHFDGDYFADLTANTEAYDPYEINEELSLPEAPGILFYVDKGVSTFCVRAYASEDLDWSLDQLKGGDKNICKALKWSEDEELSMLRYFQTESLEEAQVVADQLANQRFPRQEDVLCNLSDPGFSWWMDEGEGYFQIFFQSHGIERSLDYVKLGPLGDSLIAGMRFKQAEPLLRRLIPIKEFSVTDKGIAMSAVRTDSPEFENFKCLFLEGDGSFETSKFEELPNGRTLGLYFKEINLVRNFWLQVEKLLD